MWDNFNGAAGRKYTTTTTLVDVKIWFNSDFATLDTKTMGGCINKDNNILVELLDRIIVVAVIEDDEETT